jgi:hypothetical protein
VPDAVQQQKIPLILVVALGGGDARKVKAVELLKSTAGAVLLFTGEPSDELGRTIQYEEAVKLHDLYLKFGAPGGVIPLVVSHDTISDFRVIYDVMVGARITNAVIVDSDYHAPRSKMIASMILSPYFNYSFVTVPTPGGVKYRFGELIAMIRNFITLKTGIKL